MAVRTSAEFELVEGTRNRIGMVSCLFACDDGDDRIWYGAADDDRKRQKYPSNFTCLMFYSFGA